MRPLRIAPWWFHTELANSDGTQLDSGWLIFRGLHVSHGVACVAISIIVSISLIIVVVLMVVVGPHRHHRQHHCDPHPPQYHLVIFIIIHKLEIAVT